MNNINNKYKTRTALQLGKTALEAPDTARYLRYYNYPLIISYSQVINQTFSS